jgi:hypothetical protein
MKMKAALKDFSRLNKYFFLIIHFKKNNQHAP